MSGILVLAGVAAKAQTTSWRGTTSAAWATAANWTNGVPTSTVDAILGDANFTGTFNPSVTATANCRALTLGGGARTITLTSNALLNVFDNLDIQALGTINHTANSISLRGNWSRTGTYTPTVTTATVVFSGTTQSINNTTSFSRVTVNTGSTVSLAASITVTNAFAITGIFDPVTTTNLVTLTGATFTLNAGSQLRVRAALFSGNYSINPTTLNATSVVDYASSSINQTIATLGYGGLTISGGTVKTLAGNTVMQSTSAAAGRVNLNAGTLDLGLFTLNRNATGGGIFTVVNGTQLIIGGTNTFPANYTTYTIGATSTVVYGGNDQAVSAKTYGHLILSGTTGNVTKTFAATAMTIAGDLTSTVGTATSLAFTANAVLTINGNVSIGASTTFNAGAATHLLAGNWTNAGTLNGNTGTIRFNGTSKVISGAGVQSFNNLTIAGNGVTCSSTNVTLTGNLATTGSGTFTHNAGGTLTLSGTTKTITGTGIVVSNLVITGTVTTTASFTIGGNLTTNGSLGATAGTITFSAASAVIAGSGTTTFFALAVPNALSTAINISVRSNISGAGKLTATAGTIAFIGTSTVSGTHDLFNITVNGTLLQLGANAVISLAGTLTITAGTFNTTTTTPNTFIYSSAGNQNVTAATYNILTLATGGTKTAVGATMSNGNFTISSGVTFNAATFTHTIGGNWINNGTFTPSTSTVAFNGALSTTTTGATTFNNLTMNKSTAATTVTLNNNVSTTNLTMTQGRMLTGADSITVTGTRTGNAAILGTITRTHAFAANTAYAFESNVNTITFTSIAGGSITSVTVTVLSAPVADFPGSGALARSYDISVTKTGTYVATVRLHYADTELNGNVEANMKIWRYLAGTWTDVGRSANDVTNNWVQQTAFTDITGRWTFFDGSSTLTWLGTTSTAWANTANWKTGILPTSVDNVLIGTETFTNQPSITTAVSVKSVTFGSVKAVALTVGGGAGALNVGGNLSGDWAADQTHTVSVGARPLTVSGDLILSNGSALRRIQLSFSTGTVSIAGSLTQSGAGSVTISGTGNLNIGTDFNYTSGTFSAGTGTVTYNGSADQVIAGGIVYNNLTITKAAGTASLSTPATVNGNLTLSGSSIADLNASVGVTGNVNINSGTTLTVNNGTLSVGGNWTRAGTFSPVAGSVVFNGAGSQSITSSSFNNITINKTSGVATATGDLTVNGDLSISSGTLDIATFLTNRSTAGGTLTISSGATLTVGGGANFPAGYDTKALASGSTVVYNGTVSQAIMEETYGNLTLSNAGTKTFGAATPTEVNNLTNNSTAALANAATMKLNGNWVNNGVFTFGSGSSVEFKGTTTQLVSGSAVTTFGDVMVSNASSPSVSIESNQNLRGVLTLGINAIVDADGSANTSVLRVASSADNPTQDGAIGSLPSGAAVQGRVTVERYMAIEGTGGQLYRYVSSPVQNGTVADLQNEIPVTGTFTGHSVCSGCNSAASLFWYDEPDTTDGIGGYVVFPAASNTEVFEPGRGYALYVYGNLLSTAKWDLRGTINSGTVNLPVSFTSSGVLANDGWNLVGNPYPATIDWNAATGWTKNNIDGTIYIRDNGTGGSIYATWNGVVGTNGGSRYIATGQSFWVKAASDLPSVSVNENVKAAGTQTTFFREGGPDDLVRITLSQGNDQDEAVVHFRPDATTEFDSNADALKLLNTGFSLSTRMEGGDKLAINSLSPSYCSSSTQLVLDNVQNGSYSLTFGELDSFTEPTAIQLVDAFTGTITDVQSTSTYSFTVTSDAASRGASRFSLQFTHEPAPMDFQVAASVTCLGLNAPISVLNTSDRVTYEVTVNNHLISSLPGNGGSMDMTISREMLLSGENAVSVIGIPNNGCGSPTVIVTKLVVEDISQPVVSSSDVCRTGKATILATGAVDGQQYRWYANAGDSIALGTGASYTTGTLTESQTYYASIATTAGCESQRTQVTARVVHFDDPTITLRHDTLVVNQPGKKQWYLNNERLPNDTLAILKARQMGRYSVVISTGTCAAEASYDYVVAGVDSEQSGASIYPNPVGGYLYFQEAQSTVVGVVMMNALGQNVGEFTLTRQGSQTTGRFDMSGLASGIYLVEIRFERERRSIRVQKN